MRESVPGSKLLMVSPAFLSWGRCCQFSGSSLSHSARCKQEGEGEKPRATWSEDLGTLPEEEGPLPLSSVPGSFDLTSGSRP